MERERVSPAFLCIKTHRNSLDYANVVHRALLVKVSQSDMPAGLVNLNWGDRGGNLLDQRQPLFPVAVIGVIDQIFQSGAS